MRRWKNCRIDFVAHDRLLKTARSAIDALAPEKSWCHRRRYGITVAPARRVSRLPHLFFGGRARPGRGQIFVDPGSAREFIRVFGGCSRARHALHIIVDQDVYAGRACLAKAVHDYPKKLMALDIINEATLCRLTDLKVIDQAKSFNIEMTL